MRCLLASIAAIALSGCAPDLPVPETTISPEARAASFPKLAPIDKVAPAIVQSPAIAEGAALAADVARLKSRAALLRGRSVEDGQTALKRSR